MTNIPEDILNRKGARRLNEVRDDVIEYLNKGLIESKNLMEWMAVDPVILLKNILPKQYLGWGDSIEKEVEEIKDPTTMKTTRLIGSRLYNLAAKEGKEDNLLSLLGTHNSDTVRCWSGFFIGAKTLDIQSKLEAIKTLAADKNSGCREIAFMAVKEQIEANLEPAISCLEPWVLEDDENVRRFAVEATRPIGVWTVKIQALKEKPEKGLPLLEPLKSDPAKYVQNAVANWLNDASKTQPSWVEELCERWQNESNTKETTYITKRAMRTIMKKRG